MTHHPNDEIRRRTGVALEALAHLDDHGIAARHIDIGPVDLFDVHILTNGPADVTAVAFGITTHTVYGPGNDPQVTYVGIWRDHPIKVYGPARIRAQAFGVKAATFQTTPPATGARPYTVADLDRADHGGTP